MPLYRAWDADNTYSIWEDIYLGNERIYTVKEGDRVLILDPRDKSESPGFNNSMMQYIGTVQIVESLHDLERNAYYVRFKDIPWAWRSSWLRKLGSNEVTENDLVKVEMECWMWA